MKAPSILSSCWAPGQEVWALTCKLQTPLWSLTATGTPTRFVWFTAVIRKELDSRIPSFQLSSDLSSLSPAWKTSHSIHLLWGSCGIQKYKGNCVFISHNFSQFSIFIYYFLWFFFFLHQHSPVLIFFYLKWRQASILVDIYVHFD